jgi:alpha-L-rhamnosidase
MLPQLQSGKNAVGVIVREWLVQSPKYGSLVFSPGAMARQASFLHGFEHHLYRWFSTETIKSGTDWKTSLSPIVFNSIYTAEHYDGRLEQAWMEYPQF